MKKFIYKTNQYLLERFPTAWNTRLIWMLLTALILHLIFFTFGFFTLTNVELLHEYRVKDIFFENGTIFLTTIISVLLLVSWLIYMFKNNAFKNFYPTTKTRLFGQFIAYLLIIFSCTTFFLSYNYGIKAYIASTYSEEQVNKEIEIANDAALFLSENISSYTLDKRRSPKPFYELYCYDQLLWKNDSVHKLQFLDRKYEYYTLKTKEAPAANRYLDSDSAYMGYVYIKTTDSLSIYYYMDSLVNSDSFVKSAVPTYYNASFTFFKSRNDKLDDEDDFFEYQNTYNPDDYLINYAYNPNFSLRNQIRNQRNYELLQRNDKAEIKQLLEDFLTFSNYYKISHNLTTQQWLDMVYHPDNFEIKNFIRTEPKDKFDKDYYEVLDLGEYSGTEPSELDKFQHKHLSDFHFDNDKLHNVFYNIEDIKASNPFMDSIHFFMWFSFFFACLIFTFRITGLKELLFSIITIGVLTLLVTLFTATLFYIFEGSNDNEIYFAMYFTLCIGTLILAIPIFFKDRVKKLIVAICLNISLTGFSLYVFLIIGIISMHQYHNCRDNTSFNYIYDCHTLLESLGLNWSYILFAIAILFMFFYSKVIKNWKALPEG